MLILFTETMKIAIIIEMPSKLINIVKKEILNFLFQMINNWRLNYDLMDYIYQVLIIEIILLNQILK